MNRGWSFFGSPLDGDVFAQVMDMNSGYLVSIAIISLATPV